MFQKYKWISILKQLRVIVFVWFILLAFLFLINAFRGGASFQGLYTRIPVASVGLTTGEKSSFVEVKALSSVFDEDPYSFATTNIGSKPSLVELRLKSPEKVSFFKLDFRARVSDFDIYGYLDDRWNILSSVSNNKKDYVDVHIENNNMITTDRYMVVFKKSEDKTGDIGIFGIRVFKENGNSNLIAKLFASVFIIPRGGLGYLVYFLAIPYVVVITGLGVFVVFGRKLQSMEDVGLLFGLGILLVSLFGLLGIILSSDSLVNILFLGFILICTFVVIRKSSYDAAIFRPVLLVFFIYGIILLTYSLAKTSSSIGGLGLLDSHFDFTPNYTIPFANYEQDFLIPFGISKIFMYHIRGEKEISQLISIYKPSDRTPLLSLFLIPFLKLMGDRFFVFEMISIFVSLPMLVGGWLLFRILFGKMAANIGALLLLVNPWLVFAYSFAQVRLLTLFFISLYFYFVFKLLKDVDRKSFVMVGFCSAMAFLSHPFSFIYFVAVSMFIFIRVLIGKLSLKRNIGLLLKINIVPVVLLILWIGWGKLEPGHRVLMQSVETTSWSKFGDNVQLGGTTKFGTADWFLEALPSKLANLEGIFLQDPDPRMRRTWGFLRTTFPSAVSWTLVPFVVVGIIRLKKEAVPILTITFLVMFITGFIYLGYYPVIGINWYLIGLVPLMVGTAAFAISKLSKVLRLGIFLVAIIESLYINWEYFAGDATLNVSQLISRGVIGENTFLVLVRLPYLILVGLFCYLIFLEKDKNDLDLGV